jgi:hypothetical protein
MSREKMLLDVENEFRKYADQCEFSPDPYLSRERKSKILKFILEKCEQCYENGLYN